ncbi:MAG: hypothetical protein LC737_00965 [Chloroflexi bacterium]|nr:hypothetical protein [Chloroflexota bacterium]
MSATRFAGGIPPDHIADAILQTLTYADLFDYPLTPVEVYEYLIGVRATRDEVERALSDHTRMDGQIARVDGFVTLPDRHSLVGVRAQRRAAAQPQMEHAHTYARLIAHFPFVRMVALTGGLAMENAHDRDIDFLIVTQAGRLWLVRGLTVALVRLVRLRGDHLCPNFLLSENALTIPDQNLYGAHELAQMIPLYGLAVYRRMRQSNAWALAFLPNAERERGTHTEIQLGRVGAILRGLAEQLLRGHFGERIERWEMQRKLDKLTAQISREAAEAQFSADVCRGFLSGHGQRVLHAFRARLNQTYAQQNHSV